MELLQQHILFTTQKLINLKRKVYMIEQQVYKYLGKKRQSSSVIADKTSADRILWNWKKTKYSWRINTRKNMMNAILEASKIAAKWEIDLL